MQPFFPSGANLYVVLGVFAFFLIFFDLISSSLAQIVVIFVEDCRLCLVGLRGSWPIWRSCPGPDTRGDRSNQHVSTEGRRWSIGLTRSRHTARIASWTGV